MFISGTVLHWAIHHGAKDMVNVLIRNGASVFETDFSGRNCLMQIIQSKHIDILESRETILLILDQLKRADSNVVASHLRYLIHYACYLGRLRAVKTLIDTWELEKYVLKRDCFGDNALVIAMRMGYLDIAEYIMKRLKLHFVPDLPSGDPDIVVPNVPLDVGSAVPSTSEDSSPQSSEGTSHVRRSQEDELVDVEGELVVSVRSIMHPQGIGAQDEGTTLPLDGNKAQNIGTDIRNNPPCVLMDVSAVEHGATLPSVTDYRNPDSRYSSSGSSGSSGTSGHTLSDPPTCHSGSSNSSSGSSRKSTTPYGNYQPTSAKQFKSRPVVRGSSSPSEQLRTSSGASQSPIELSSPDSDNSYYETDDSCPMAPCCDVSENSTFYTSVSHEVRRALRRSQGPRIDLRHYLIHRIYSLQVCNVYL